MSSADYMRGGRELVNFYVAWYDSQRAGNSAHSPRSCLPGGGWRITELDQINVGDLQVAGKPLRVNRVQIETRQPQTAGLLLVSAARPG